MSLGAILGFAVLMAAVLAIGGGLLSLVTFGDGWKVASSDRNMHSGAVAVGGGIGTFIVSFIANAIFFAWWMPVFTGAGWVGWVITNLMITAVVFGVCNFIEEADTYGDSHINLAWVVSLLMAVVILVGPLWLWNNWWLGNDNAKKLAHQLDVTMVDEKQEVQNYPKTDENHMVIVGEQNAHLKASSIMNQGDIGTKFSLGKGDLQSVSGHMYYVYPLNFSSLKQAQDAALTVPGYIQVDAEDPNADPKLHDGYEIKYWLGGPFSASLDRLIYSHYQSYFVDDPTLEVDDSGRPFYTASLNRSAVRWRDGVPQKFITVDAQTGEIKEYPLNQIPAWVDRVYSATTAEKMLNWWGEWGNADYAYLREGTANRYKVNGGLNLVYTDEGPAWQALMVSYNNDASVQYVALMDTKSNHVRMFKAPNGLLTEGRVTDAFQQSPNNLKKLDPTGLALHKVYGRLVWVASMVASGHGGATDSGLPSKEAFAGVGLLEANQPDSARVIIGLDKGDAFGKLSAQIATGGNNTSPEANANTKSAQGAIASLTQVVTGGNTFVIIMIAGDNDHLYRGQVTEAPWSLAMALAQTGDQATITYLDSGNPVRNIASFTSPRLAGIK